MSPGTSIKAFLRAGIRRVHLPASRKARFALIAVAAMAAADVTILIGGAALSAYGPAWTQHGPTASPRARLRALTTEVAKQARPQAIPGDFGAVLLTYHDFLRADADTRGRQITNLFDIEPDQWIRMLREQGNQAGLGRQLAQVDLGKDGSITSTSAENVSVLFDLLRDDRIVAHVFARWLASEIDRVAAIKGSAPTLGEIASLALAGGSLERDVSSLQAPMVLAMQNASRDDDKPSSNPAEGAPKLTLSEVRNEPARFVEAVEHIVRGEGLNDNIATALLAVSTVSANDTVRDHLYGLPADTWFEALKAFASGSEFDGSVSGTHTDPDRFFAASGHDAARALSTRDDVVLATRVVARRLASESVDFERRTGRTATARDLFSVHFFGGKRAAGYVLEPEGSPIAKALLAHSTLASEALAKADEMHATTSHRIVGPRL
jgi:hypothetical protein